MIQSYTLDSDKGQSWIKSHTYYSENSHYTDHLQSLTHKGCASCRSRQLVKKRLRVLEKIYAKIKQTKDLENKSRIQLVMIYVRKYVLYMSTLAI